MTRVFQSIVNMAAAMLLSPSTATIPSIDLFLTPTFDPQTNAAASIPCRMVISGLTLGSNESFLQLNLLNANVPSNRYDGSALRKPAFAVVLLFLHREPGVGALSENMYLLWDIIVSRGMKQRYLVI